MTLSLEARWFCAEPLPSALRDWMESLDPDDPFSWTDYYLPSEDPGLNLKLRDGKVQIKRRLAGPFRQNLGTSVNGRYEQWVKWSFSVSDAPSLPDTDPTALWVPVEKTRVRHTFSETEQASLTEKLPTSPPARAQMELTEVTAATETAWTVCLEAEGPASGLSDTLTALGPALFTDEFPVSLSAEQSYGYARWLQELSPDIGRPAPEVLFSKDTKSSL